MSVVFRTGFEPAVAVLRWMLPGIVALTGARILSADLMGRGKSGYSRLTSLAGAAVTFLALLALVPPFGLTGAAVSSTVVYGILFMLSLT